jgi:hypothetical protein
MDLFTALWRIVDPQRAAKLRSPLPGASKQDTPTEPGDAALHSVETNAPGKATIEIVVRTRFDSRAAAPERGYSALRPASAAGHPSITANDGTGFPREFSERVAAVQIPFFETYYPSYQMMNPAQKRAYVYFRQEFRNGITIADMPLSYLFLYSYEIGSRSSTLAEFGAQLTRLREAYIETPKLARYLATWVTDARICMKHYEWDDIARSTSDPNLRVDLALLAGLPPDTGDVLSIIALNTPRRLNPRMPRVLQALRETKNVDPILASATKEPSGSRSLPVFSGYAGNVPGLPNGYRRSVQVPSFVQPGSPTLEAILALVREAMDIIGDSTVVPADPDLEFVRVPGTVQRVPIDRSTVRPEGRDELTAFDGLAGFGLSINSFWNDDMRVLMALVLWQADVKPYIEGVIAFSRDLRIKYDALATALGAETGLGPYRRAFFNLSTGTRAPWSLDADAQAAIDVKMGKANARFVKGLQHDLRGSAAQGQILTLLVSGIARDRNTSPAAVVDALATATGNDRPLGFVLT